MILLRIVLGFVVAAFMIFSSFMHSILGWKSMSGQLRDAHAPEDLIANLALAWHLSGAVMFTFGVILILLFSKFLKNRATPLWVGQCVALFYACFGVWALVESRNPFFAIMFVVPGALLLFAASGSSPKPA
jgi:hypothetical protein